MTSLIRFECLVSKNNKSKKGATPKSSNVREKIKYPVRNAFELSPCALKYALAISDPWSPEASGACVPILPSRPSMKRTMFLRGFGAIGENGYGAVTFAPCLASDGISLCYTDTNYTGVGDDIVDVTTGVVGVALPGAFTTAQMSNSTDYGSAVVSGRIVSASVKVQNLCPLLDESGAISMLSAPNRENTALLSVANMGAFRECLVQPYVKRKSYEITTSAIARAECEYPSEYTKAASSPQETIIKTYPFSNGTAEDATSTSKGAAPLKMIISGKAGSSFMWEVVVHAEYVGALASQASTPNESDPNGFELVQTASAQLPELQVANPNQSLRSLMGRALSEIWRHRRPIAAAASAFVGGRAVHNRLRLTGA